MANRVFSLSCVAGLLFSIVSASGAGQSNSSGAAGSNAQSPPSGGQSAHRSAIPNQGLGPIVVPKDLSELRVVPGDLLGVTVYDAPELNNSYRVDRDGNLTLPLCGTVQVQGLTLAEVERRLESTLKIGEILTQPQVTVDVQQYASQYVTVLGEVFSPGKIPVIAPTSLGDVLAQAGGLTQLAGGHIGIRHGSNSNEEDVHFVRSQANQQSASILVRPGDTITVPRAGIVYVFGAVNRPGGYVMQEDGKLNVAEVLALSGGTLMQARTNGLRVIRRNPDGTASYFSLSYDGIAKGQTPLALQPQDIVYVPISKFKATFASTSGLIGQTATAAIYAAR